MLMQDTTKILTDAFVRAQEIAREDAERIASKVLLDDDISKAAEHWANTGEFPATPIISGHSPRSLSAKYRPTQVFTVLLGLRQDPVHAEKMLISFGRDSDEHLHLL